MLEGLIRILQNEPDEGLTEKVKAYLAGKEGDATLIEAAGHLLSLTLENRALQKKTIEDALTGVYNRAYFERRLQQEVDKTRRYGHPFSLLMLDIDRFKSFNDTYGHQAGDQVLRIVGKVLRENIRFSDLAFRYGGEEFAIILLHASHEEAELVAERLRLHLDATIHTAERLRRGVKRSPLVRDGRAIPISISIGISAFSGAMKGVDVPALIRMADESLYRAKHMGRDRSEVVGKDEKLNMLIVDDEEEYTRLLKDFFAGRGYDVLTASSGEQALQRLKERRFNVMLLDLRMPGMTGIEVLRRIPERVKTMKIMVLTAADDGTLVEASYRYGASEFIHKPISVDYLNRHVMARILETRT